VPSVDVGVPSVRCVLVIDLLDDDGWACPRVILPPNTLP
jgi:hypothetical protein